MDWKDISLRVWAFLKSRPVFRAFVISALLHLFAGVGIELGRSLNFWQVSVFRQAPARQTINPNDPNKSNPNEQPVLTFIEVDPLQPTEAPKDAVYYSTANTQAANPDTTTDSNKPKIDGNQDKVPQTRDTARSQQKPQPKAPQRETMQPAVKQTAQAPSEPVGDTKENTLSPDEKAQRDLTFDRPAQKAPTRPKNLAEARARNGIVEAPRMKQDGGVKRFALEMDQNVKSSPFGSYDAAFIAAVQSRWFQLLEQRNYVFNQSGKVVIDFRLYKDGRIMQLKVAENEVTDTLSWACQRAILDPAPYAAFPSDLRRLLNADYREVRFTFHYN